jgi:AraC family transcriptional regulator
MASSHGEHPCVGASVTEASWPGLHFGFLRAPSGDCPEHAHDQLHVVHAVRGRFLQISETSSGRRRRTTIAPGGSYVVAAGQRHEASWGGEIETACLHLSNDFLHEVASDRPRAGAMAPRDGLMSDRGPAAPGYFHALRTALAHAPRSRLVAESAATLLVDALLGAERFERAAMPLDADSLARVADFIEASLGEDLSLRAMARVAGRSPSHFARTFRAATGVSPAAYVRARRIVRAREALQHEDVSLAELALRLGFASQAHFTTAFRLQAGMTPAAFRRVARI